MDQSIDIRPIWLRLWSQRRSILMLAFFGGLMGVAAAFLLPRWYRAQTSLLPPSESESGFGLVSLLRGIAVPGISIPTQATPADMFLSVLASRRLNQEMITDFGLKLLYKKKLDEDAIKELSLHTKFKLTEAGTIEITVEDRDPKRAAAIANGYVVRLDRFNREVRMTKGRRTREFLDRRLKEAKAELESAEQLLANYESKHRSPALSPEMSAAAEAAARLYAQRAALQVRLGVVESYARGGSDEATAIHQQMRSIEQQLGALPETGLQQARLFRRVKTLEQVWVLLSAQYEESRIDEARDVTTVEVLDPAVPPERHARPKRSIVALLGLLLGLGVGMLGALRPGRILVDDPRMDADTP
ncbi:MAG: GNVR domain-containing protein [Candidatus Eisenbacteria bacterium]